MRDGNPYNAVLTKDMVVDEFFCDEHVSFVEEAPLSRHRNPRVFDGRYITITRWEDGSYRANLKLVVITDGFDIVRYATAVGNKLLWGLESLVEK